jgi:3-hydroxyisobutyrate dehydrogenase-like beta-hydroxyacid dehydrogenase
MSQKIAFLGLGTMGAPMAGRLVSAGYDLTAWNRTNARTEPLVALGATAAASPADAVEDADVVITMLSDPEAVSSVVRAIAPAIQPSATLIEASTIGPRALDEIAGVLPSGVNLVDAPVMGSMDRAASGELSLLVGGDISTVRPILEVFGSITECGATGGGSALKLVLIGAIVAGITVVGEAMALADALDLPTDLVTTALAHSPLAALFGRATAEGSLFQVHLAAKDVALGTAAANLPIARAVHARLLDFPDAVSEDVGQIVQHIRTDIGSRG